MMQQTKPIPCHSWVVVQIVTDELFDLGVKLIVTWRLMVEAQVLWSDSSARHQ